MCGSPADLMIKNMKPRVISYNPIFTFFKKLLLHHSSMDNPDCKSAKIHEEIDLVSDPVHAGKLGKYISFTFLILVAFSYK